MCVLTWCPVWTFETFKAASSSITLSLPQRKTHCYHSQIICFIISNSCFTASNFSIWPENTQIPVNSSEWTSQFYEQAGRAKCLEQSSSHRQWGRCMVPECCTQSWLLEGWHNRLSIHRHTLTLVTSKSGSKLWITARRWAELWFLIVTLWLSVWMCCVSRWPTEGKKSMGIWQNFFW